MQKDYVSITQKVTFRQICDTLCAAFEGGAYGSGYWLSGKRYEGRRKVSSATPWYNQPDLFQSTGTAVIFSVQHDDLKQYEGNGKANRNISRMDIVRGLQLMAANSAAMFAELIADNGDGDTGDVMLQYIVFGDVVYG